MSDTRLVGRTAENIFLSILNENDVVAYALDTDSFDGMVFDTERKYFRVGTPPFFVQIKCRGSKRSDYNSQGHNEETFNKIRETAKKLQVEESALYFILGFFKNNDIRDIIYFVIPFGSRGSGDTYRFLGSGDTYRFLRRGQ